tara:strand:+ start:89 stop:3457 length:3369 start_codon:yes stop_codon:yes gene_type:complete
MANPQKEGGVKVISGSEKVGQSKHADIAPTEEEVVAALGSREDRRVSVRGEGTHQTEQELQVNPESGEHEWVTKVTKPTGGAKQFGGGAVGYKTGVRQGVSQAQTELEHSKKEHLSQHTMGATLAALDKDRAEKTGLYDHGSTKPPEGHVRVVMPSGRDENRPTNEIHPKYIPEETYQRIHPGLEGGTVPESDPSLPPVRHEIPNPRGGNPKVSEIIQDPIMQSFASIYGGHPFVDMGHKECPECQSGNRAGLKRPPPLVHQWEHIMGDPKFAWHVRRLNDGTLTNDDQYGIQQPELGHEFFNMENKESWGSWGLKSKHDVQPMTRDKMEELLHYLGVHPGDPEELAERFGRRSAVEEEEFGDEELNHILGLEGTQEFGTQGNDAPTSQTWSNKKLTAFHPSKQGIADRAQRDMDKNRDVKHGQFKWKPWHSEAKDEEDNPITRKGKRRGGLGSPSEPDIGSHLEFMMNMLKHEQEAKERKEKWMMYGGGAANSDLGETLEGGHDTDLDGNPTPPHREGKTPCALCAGHGTVDGHKILSFFGAHEEYNSITPLNQTREVWDDGGYKDEVDRASGKVDETNPDHESEKDSINEQLTQLSRPFHWADWAGDEPLARISARPSEEYVCPRCTGLGTCVSCAGKSILPVPEGAAQMSQEDHDDFYKNYANFAHAMSVGTNDPRDPRFLQSWTDPMTGEQMPSYFQTEPGEGQWEPRGQYLKPQIGEDKARQVAVQSARAGRQENRQPWGGFSYGSDTIEPFRAEVPDQDKTIREERAVRGPRQERQEANQQAGEWGGFEPGSMFGGPPPPPPPPQVAPAPLPPPQVASAEERADLPPMEEGESLEEYMHRITPPPVENTTPPQKIDEEPMAESPEGFDLGTQRGFKLQPHEENGWPTATPFERLGSKAYSYGDDMGVWHKNKRQLVEHYPGPRHGFGSGAMWKDPDNWNHDMVSASAKATANHRAAMSVKGPDYIEDIDKREKAIKDAARKEMQGLHEKDREMSHKYAKNSMLHHVYTTPNKVWESKSNDYVDAALRLHPDLMEEWHNIAAKDEYAAKNPGNTRPGELALFRAIRSEHPDWVMPAGSTNHLTEEETGAFDEGHYNALKGHFSSPIDCAFFILKSYS